MSNDTIHQLWPVSRAGIAHSSFVGPFTALPGIICQLLVCSIQDSGMTIFVSFCTRADSAIVTEDSSAAREQDHRTRTSTATIK